MKTKFSLVVRPSPVAAVENKTVWFVWVLLAFVKQVKNVKKDINIRYRIKTVISGISESMSRHLFTTSPKCTY